jgi:hypothetical protein
LVSAISFILGRAISDSEKILAEKRRVYEQFLVSCPKPNNAYESRSEDGYAARVAKIDGGYAPFLLYAAPSVVLAANEYITAFSEADEKLTPESLPLHEAYKVVAKARNDLILEIRRAALGWSAFGYLGINRLPKNALEQAKRNSL